VVLVCITNPFKITSNKNQISNKNQKFKLEKDKEYACKYLTERHVRMHKHYEEIEDFGY